MNEDLKIEELEYLTCIVELQKVILYCQTEIDKFDAKIEEIKNVKN